MHLGVWGAGAFCKGSSQNLFAICDWFFSLLAPFDHARTRSAGLVLWLSYKLSPQSIAAQAKEDWGAAPNPARGRAPGPHHLLGQS